MHVGLIIERMETWRGGAETSTAQFARELGDRGHRVSLFTASRGVSEPGVTVHTVDVPGTRARRANAFRDAVAEALAQYPVDVTHSMTALFGGDVFMPRGGTVAETIEGNLRIRRTAAGRALKRFANLFNRRQRAMLRIERDLLAREPADGGPRRIVALSGYVQEQLQQHYGLGPPRVVEVFNGVALDPPAGDARSAARRTVREQWQVSDDALLMVFVAHNFKLKGLRQLLDGLAELRRRHPRLAWRALVVGRDRPRPYTARVAQLDLGDSVIFTGATERVTRLYRAADLLVLPTFYDPCSRVVLEALSQGTPAVTTRYNGAGEVLAASGDATPAGRVIADPHNPAELAEAIAHYGAPAKREAASAAALALADHISMARHTDQMLKIYEELLAE